MQAPLPAQGKTPRTTPKPSRPLHVLMKNKYSEKGKIASTKRDLKRKRKVTKTQFYKAGNVSAEEARKRFLAYNNAKVKHHNYRAGYFPKQSKAK